MNYKWDQLGLSRCTLLASFSSQQPNIWFVFIVFSWCIAMRVFTKNNQKFGVFS